MESVSNGSRKWPTSHWQRLLRDTVAIIGSLKPPVSWTFGGGTALAVHLQHRISYDIDAFVSSSDIIRDLTPNKNQTTRRILGNGKYEYPGNYLKLCFDYGEIDFIVASSLTDNPIQEWKFEETIINLETPSEIIVKKIFYRPSSFKVRDVYDFAAFISCHHGELSASLHEVADKIDKVTDRIAKLAPAYERAAQEEINPTELGRQFMTRNAIESVLDFLKSWKPS